VFTADVKEKGMVLIKLKNIDTKQSNKMNNQNSKSKRQNCSMK